jgi:hypothetical protein
MGNYVGYKHQPSVEDLQNVYLPYTPLRDWLPLRPVAAVQLMRRVSQSLQCFGDVHLLGGAVAWQI